MVVSTVPSLIVQTAFDLVQPGFGALIYLALVDKGQKYFRGLIAEGAGVAEHDIHLPIPLLQPAIELATYGNQKIVAFWMDENCSTVRELVFVACVLSAGHFTALT